MKDRLSRLVRALPGLITAAVLLVLAAALLALVALALALLDLAWMVAGRRQTAPDTQPNRAAASLVIPNWNGKICWNVSCLRGWRPSRTIRAVR